MTASYRTTPTKTARMPAGIPYIVGNEAAERFSFYGMKAILAVFMTEHLVNRSGDLAVMSNTDAKFYLHSFVVAGYLFPLIGAILADWIFGKYRTILWLSIIYCLGHLSLAVDETRLGLGIGLALIAVGTGAIKPCVSAHVGDQFGNENRHLLSRVFGWFYLAINLGALASTLLTPILLNEKSFHDLFGSLAQPLADVGIVPGPSLAFGVPGILMALATLVFWLGRNTFVHVPPRGKAFLREALSGEGLRALGSLIPIYLCVAAFWCLFDQTAKRVGTTGKIDGYGVAWGHLVAEPTSGDQPAFHPHFCATFLLYPLSSDRPDFPAHTTAKNWTRHVPHDTSFFDKWFYPSLDRCRSDALNWLAGTRIRTPHRCRGYGQHHMP